MSGLPSPESVARELATARARMLGRLAGTLAHDLANVLAAATGLAGELLPRHAEDAALLSQLDHGARRGAALTRLLAKLLGQGPDGNEQIELTELLEGARNLVERHCVRRGVPLAWILDRAGKARVRVPVAEATQALLGLVLGALEAGVAGLELTASVGECAVAGGRVRPVASVELRLQSPAPSLSAAAVRAVAMPSGAPTGLVLDPVGEAFAQAALVMAAGGGELVVGTTEPVLCLALHWPLAMD